MYDFGVSTSLAKFEVLAKLAFISSRQPPSGTMMQITETPQNFLSVNFLPILCPHLSLRPLAPNSVLPKMVKLERADALHSLEEIVSN